MQLALKTLAIFYTAFVCLGIITYLALPKELAKQMVRDPEDTLSKLFKKNFFILGKERRQVTTTTEHGGLPIRCESSFACNHGDCVEEHIGVNQSDWFCECEDNYRSLDEDGEYDMDLPCDYHLKSGVAVLVLSILFGFCGIDWCFLSRGSCAYVCIGIVKPLTLGGCGVWFLTDIIRIAAESFPDGNGVELREI